MKSKGTESCRKEGGVSGSKVKEDKKEKCPLFLATGRLVVPSVSSEASLQRGKTPDRRQLEQGPATQGGHAHYELSALER